jgi:hypothetical protein
MAWSFEAVIPDDPSCGSIRNPEIIHFEIPGSMLRIAPE